jgi:uncharacterized protein YcbK (DUF882 family)
MNHFFISEFDSPDLKGSGQFMDETFLSMIDEARRIANVPFKINSGFRTVEHNATVKGKKSSSHLKGLAADISCVDSRSRFNVLSALIVVGFHRIGVSKSFIHCDIDIDKPKEVIWMY